MKRSIFFFIILFTLSNTSCGNAEGDTRSTASDDTNASNTKPHQIIDSLGMTLETRILPPEGFTRLKSEPGSFALFLRNLPLKPHGSEVKTYTGETVHNFNVYAAVVDKKIGNKDLHQCADAVMRLRAEYLYENGLYDKIHFNFTNGKTIRYSEWMKGKRIVVKGNSSTWVQSATPSNTPNDLWNYLTVVFNYAGSFSLSKELVPVDVKDMQIGDVFIKGGFPGHAVIVADMAVNETTGEKIFLLAQSYMPAQEIHILLNPNKEQNPWYSLKDNNYLYTPLWNFNYNELMRFKED
jgi:hypothetical protein